MRRRTVLFVLLAALFASVLPLSAQSSSGTILSVMETTKLLPDAVFFAGQSASTQLRNSGGVHYADNLYTLVTLVDNSGYSSGVKEKYQAYFITEAPLSIGGHPLPAGIYGVGFLTGNRFNVMDVGAHDLLTTPSTHDDQMKRPRPLLILPTAAPGTYRLCSGRDCVEFKRAK
ncbi:hypothetical protein D0Y96_002525 [Acidipila sp. 4G-K13]|uniref:Uncharacterized protein n=1 Tax=Paracidobacterium acidisoli TaxID=2303751 RepID=A0A372IUZ4_9BACT|nr:hypothetical protein [Paracidobacterium acidisoli]